jgi:hypothetical protein
MLAMGENAAVMGNTLGIDTTLMRSNSGKSVHDIGGSVANILQCKRHKGGFLQSGSYLTISWSCGSSYPQNLWL